MKKKKLSVKDRLGNTVLELLGEKNISDIKISELTEKANVARASFYRNFNSFDEVLDYIALGYAKKFNDQIKPMIAEKDYNSWYNVVHKVLLEIYDKKDNFTDTLSSNLRVIFYKVQKILERNSNHEWVSSPLVKYEHIGKLSAFYSVCMAWIQDGTKESIDDMTLFMLEKVLQIFNY